MFTEPTVIILGAGSSAEFGLPTGRAIFDHIAAPSNPILSKDLNEMPKRYSTFGSTFNDFYIKRIGNRENLSPLFKKGRQGYHQSIDQLATRNLSLLETSKLLSAWCILSRVYIKELKPYSTNSNFRRIVPSYNWRNSRIGQYRNWVGAIVEKYREAGSSKQDLLKNNLSVVTFNYDTLFADAFLHFLKIDEDCEKLESDSLPALVHIFGSFGNIRESMHLSEIEYAAERISFMEEMLNESNSEVEAARTLITSAKKILLVGFDCDRRNVDLIGLKSSEADIYAINYDGNEALNVKLTEELKVPNEHIMSGNSNSPIGVSEAFEKGFLAFPDRFSNKSFYEFHGAGST
ncbi:MAG: hypothetical protein ACSHXY_00190 [Alphaproteobacteria bacterium]